jgi:PAS domain S-box-containing protein
MKDPQVADVSPRSDLIGAWKVFRQVGLTVPGILLCVLIGLPAAAQQNSKNVLFVFSSSDQPRRDLDLLENALRARVPQNLDFYTSYVDFERMGDVAYQDSLAQTFHHAYKNVKLDLAIVSSIEALRFVLYYRKKILPGVPIVFYALSAKELRGEELPTGITGRTSDVGLRETINLALRLHPDAQAVAIVTEGPGFWWEVARSELNRHRDRVKEIDLFGPAGNEILKKIAALPPHTVILFQLATLSGKETEIKANDVLAAAAKQRPTYCAWKASFRLGCIGGAYVNWEKYIGSTAETAARVLSGERPENIPVVDDSNFETQVNWQQLRRWHIPESALPPGSVVLFREPSLWESYRKYILVIIAVIVSQALLIAGLLWQRTRKRRAEAVLRESEERFRVMADSTPSLVWMCDAHGHVTYLNERRVGFTGRDPKAGFGDAWTTYIHPVDRQNVLDTVSQGLKNHQAFSHAYRLRRNDGVYRWMLDVASPRVNGDGSFGGFIGSAIDTTEQKLAHQALEKISGQLIEAQEQERSRIARELHDDICQRLALLSMEIDQANLAVDGAPPTTKKKLEEIGDLCAEIGSDVQSLSHQLHSSILDCLGIAMAISGLCDELSKQYDVRVDFTEENVRKHLPKDISLCLFRIAQEALHNAVKYSGVSEFAVELREDADTIQLLVMDQGAGFDVEEAKKEGGLGLVSMQERAHLVHGAISFESKPGEGTKVIAIVPLADTHPVSWADERDDEIASVTGAA